MTRRNFSFSTITKDRKELRKPDDLYVYTNCKIQNDYFNNIGHHIFFKNKEKFMPLIASV